VSPPPIALLTDYGLRDGYHGALRAVIFSICPDARFLDVSHDVPPQNILTGAHLLASAGPYLPRGCIVLGVVDPGVGGTRHAIAVRTERMLLVGPDNGLFSLLYRQDPPVKALELNQQRFLLGNVSRTFHGRDIFAPVAAHLANDIPFDSLGTPIDVDSLVRLSFVEPEADDVRIECHVVHVDGFGNLITDLERGQYLEWSGDAEVHIVVNSRRVYLADTFTSVAEGEPLAYFGSTGRLEIAVRNRNAAEVLGVQQSGTITVHK